MSIMDKIKTGTDEDPRVKQAKETIMKELGFYMLPAMTLSSGKLHQPELGTGPKELPDPVPAKKLSFYNLASVYQQINDFKKLKQKEIGGEYHG